MAVMASGSGPEISPVVSLPAVYLDPPDKAESRPGERGCESDDLGRSSRSPVGGGKSNFDSSSATPPGVSGPPGDVSRPGVSGASDMVEYALLVGIGVVLGCVE